MKKTYSLIFLVISIACAPIHQSKSTQKPTDSILSGGDDTTREIELRKFTLFCDDFPERACLELKVLDQANSHGTFLAAILSKLMYTNALEIDKHAKVLGINVIALIEKNDIRAGIFRHRNNVFVAFRGTDLSSVNNIKTDLQFMFSTFGKEGSVHIGFLSAYASIQKTLTAYIEREGDYRIDGDDYRLWFTGHSLGGAIATLASYDFALKGLKTSLYTFGSPRVVGSGLATKIIRKVFPIIRLVYGNDIIATIPSPLIGYQHVGKMIGIDLDCTIGSDEKFVGKILRSVKIKSVKDHSMLNYLNCLEKNLIF